MRGIFILFILALSLTLSSKLVAKEYTGGEAEKIIVEGEILPVTFMQNNMEKLNSFNLVAQLAVKYKGALYLCSMRKHPHEPWVDFRTCYDSDLGR